jgi:hypothetical protein
MVELFVRSVAHGLGARFGRRCCDSCMSYGRRLGPDAGPGAQRLVGGAGNIAGTAGSDHPQANFAY